LSFVLFRCGYRTLSSPSARGREGDRCGRGKKLANWGKCGLKHFLALPSSAKPPQASGPSGATPVVSRRDGKGCWPSGIPGHRWAWALLSAPGNSFSIVFTGLGKPLPSKLELLVAANHQEACHQTFPRRDLGAAIVDGSANCPKLVDLRGNRRLLALADSFKEAGMNHGGALA
jgi:hypothetical protein